MYMWVMVTAAVYAVVGRVGEGLGEQACGGRKEWAVSFLLSRRARRGGIGWALSPASRFKAAVARSGVRSHVTAVGTSFPEPLNALEQEEINLPVYVWE